MTDLMILPSKDHTRIRMIRVPKDYEQHEAYRHVTGLIAEAECGADGCAWEDIAEALEAQGYEVVECMLGPSLD